MSPSVAWHELRHAIRAIVRAKGATAVLVLSLALGTGVNAAVFGVLDALLLRAPAGVEDASRLVNIYTSEFSGAACGLSSHPDFASVKSSASSFTAMAAVDDGAIENVRLGDAGGSARIAAVSEDFFAVLEMQASRGRLLAPADAWLSPPAAVVSFGLSDELGGADKIVGKTIAIRDGQYTVAGVTPPRFRGLQAGRESDAWILMTAPATARGDRRLSIVARLRRGVTVSEAEDDLRRISHDLAAAHPATNRGSVVDKNAPRLITPVRHSPLDPGAGAQVFVIGLVVGGASVLLLASASLNVGSLLLSRAVARRRDLAIKMALGATRATLVRELLTETLCLSLAGGALGLLFAIWTATAIPALFAVEQAERLDTRLDAGVVLLTVGVACLAGAIFGVAPALHGTAAPAVTALRADAGGVSAQHGGARLRALLVGAQVALSTVLLLTTGHLVTSLTHALQGEMASTLAKVAVVSIELPGRFADPARGIASRNALLEGLPSLAGVEAVSWASTLPLGRGNRRQFRIEADATDVTDTVEFESNVVSSMYFRSLLLPLVEGRLFDEGDSTLAPPVVIVDELLAQRYFGPAAVGRHLIDRGGARVQVVGVVRSGRYRTLQQSPQPTVYYPSTQDYLWRGHLIVRTTRDPAGLLDSIRQVVQRLGKGAAILETATMEAHVSNALALDRLTTTLVGLCGAIGLAMSTIGVYGVMADAVQRQTREIGLRVALGAGRTQVARLVLVHAAHLAATGAAIGAGAAFAAGAIARAFVYGVPSFDIVTLVAASGMLAAVTAGAAIVPLRRALRVHPNIALREE